MKGDYRAVHLITTTISARDPELADAVGRVLRSKFGRARYTVQDEQLLRTAPQWMVPPTALQIISSAGASSSRGQTTPQTTRPDNLSKTQPTGQKAVLANSAAELRTSSEDLTKLPGLDAQIAQLSRDLTLSMNGHADEIRLKYEDALADKEIKEAISHSQIPPHEVAIIRMRNRLYEQRNRITGIDHSARPRRGDRWDAGRF